MDLSDKSTFRILFKLSGMRLLFTNFCSRLTSNKLKLESKKPLQIESILPPHYFFKRGKELSLKFDVELRFLSF